jgi:phosphatidate cytidylyltransferase
MSPSLALQSPVFLFYVALAVALLVLGGLVLAALKWGLGKNVDHAWRAYGGWLLMVPVLLVVFFLGREAAIVFATLVAGLAFHEFARATGLYRDGVIAGAVYLGIGATGAACLMTDPTDGNPGWYGLFMALPAFGIAVILAIPVIRNRAQDQLRPLAVAIVGFLYFGWMFGHVAFLANSAHAYSYLGYIVVAVALNDVAAYICGKLFGRRRLRSNISPNKTWEGSVGGLAISMLLPWALLFTFPHFEWQDCVMAGLIVGIGGQLGDLVVSVIKRDVGIKDMGKTIPGHGGILDRIDSLIYAAPLFFHYVRYRHGLNSPA